MRVRDGVHTFDLDWDYDEPLSVQVIQTTEATVLFGGGDESTGTDLVDIAESYGVEVVVAEHGDGDHYAGIPALRNAIPDLEVAVPAGDRPSIEEAGIDVDQPLEAGRTYWGFETIPAPGHTPDNMAYLYGNTVVAGDTVVGADSIFAADDDWQGPLGVCTADYNADDAQTRASVSNLLDYDFDAVLVSHGENVLSDGSEAVRTLVDDLHG